MSELLSTRTFTLADQQAFVALSGDANPMHVDRIAARRMQAGVPVVHGINAMLWAIDALLAHDPAFTFDRIDARFERFIVIEEAVTLHADLAPRNARLEIRSADARLLRLDLRRAAAAPAGVAGTIGTAGALTRPRQPMFAEMRDATGRLPLIDPADAYPAVAATLGAARVASLVMLSTLVGMEVPGLYSIFSSLLADLDADTRDGRTLGYRVTDAHDLFRLLTIAADGPGVTATVKAFMRPPTAVQPSMAQLAVGANDHAGVGALVIGGSRGLGELTAKLLAAGGAEVIVTYATGSADADAVAADIRAAGGRCTAMRLDVLAPLAPQLATLPAAIGEVYYFATTRIFHQGRAIFSAQRFAEFERIYVTAFENLCRHLITIAGRDLTIFYPSSVAVADRPRGMTEYSMAKAAAEILCEDISRFVPGLRALSYRLPRLLTDQTMTVTPEEADDSIAVMTAVTDLMRAARQPARTAATK